MEETTKKTNSESWKQGYQTGQIKLAYYILSQDVSDFTVADVQYVLSRLKEISGERINFI